MPATGTKFAYIQPTDEPQSYFQLCKSNAREQWRKHPKVDSFGSAMGGVTTAAGVGYIAASKGASIVAIVSLAFFGGIVGLLTTLAGIYLCYVVTSPKRLFEDATGELSELRPLLRSHELMRNTLALQENRIGNLEIELGVVRAEKEAVEAELAKLTEHKLIFEVNRDNTNVRLDQQPKVLRIWLNLQIRFERRDEHPHAIKSLNVTFHRMGIKNVRKPRDVWAWFSILNIMSNGFPIKIDEFEGMEINSRLSPFYSIQILLSIQNDDEIKTIEDFEVTDYLRVTMQASGQQPEFMAFLHPYWKDAHKINGTTQIAITGAPTVVDDLGRIR